MPDDTPTDPLPKPPSAPSSAGTWVRSKIELAARGDRTLVLGTLILFAFVAVSLTGATMALKAMGWEVEVRPPVSAPSPPSPAP